MYNTVPLGRFAGWVGGHVESGRGGGYQGKGIINDSPVLFMVLSDDTAVFNMKQSVSWVCFVFHGRIVQNLVLGT